MSAVLQASGYARRLVEGEAKRSGTGLSEAIPAVARRLKAPPTSLWSLLFRPPKRIYSDLLDSLEDAVAKEIRREIAELENELAALMATRSALGRLNQNTVAEVEKDLARLRLVIAGEARP
jgi:ribosomal protein L29